MSATPQVHAAPPARDATHALDPHAPSVTFVAIGDSGSGASGALHVARAARAACAGRCDFGVLLGDNVYPRGIADVDDPGWDSAIERPFVELNLPLFAVLGNHDYGSPRELWFLGGAGVDPRRADAAFARARTSERVSMPGQAFRVLAGPAELVFFDTQPFYMADTPSLARALGLDDDAARIDRALAIYDLQATGRWRIAVGHHPYRSNGRHGDAGRYEGLPFPGGPFTGESVRMLLERRVLGRYALYLSGHDHNVFDMGEERGTSLIVSGAGSEHRPVASDRSAQFAAASLGFIIVSADARALALEAYTVDDDDSATPGAWRLAHRRTLATRAR